MRLHLSWWLFRESGTEYNHLVSRRAGVLPVESNSVVVTVSELEPSSPLKTPTICSVTSSPTPIISNRFSRFSSFAFVCRFVLPAGLPAGLPSPTGPRFGDIGGLAGFRKVGVSGIGGLGASISGAGGLGGRKNAASAASAWMSSQRTNDLEACIFGERYDSV